MKTKRHYLLLSLLVLLVLALLVSLTLGKTALSLSDLVAVLNGTSSSAKRLLLIDFRLPRLVLAILAGAALSYSGAVLQSVMQNPLADTGLLGINAGAGFAVLIFISKVETTTASTFLLPLVALIGAAASAVAVLAIAYKKRSGITPLRLVLTGVVVSTALSAATLLLVTKIDSESYRFVTMWQAGSIWGSNWSFIAALLPWMLVIMPWLYRKHRLFDILPLGDETAISIGIDVKKERQQSLLLAAALAGAAVSVTGGIGFVGLIAPHIARQLGMQKHRDILPVAAVLGSLLLLVSDTIGRLSPGSGEIPAGTIIAIVGAPYFLYLLLKKL